MGFETKATLVSIEPIEPKEPKEPKDVIVVMAGPVLVNHLLAFSRVRILVLLLLLQYLKVSSKF